jgi:hypothetical protein
MKKKWLLGPVFMGVLALGVIGSGAVFAQTTEPESAVSSLASQVDHGANHEANRGVDHGANHTR